MQQEQITQNESIQNNTTYIEQLQEENTLLEQNMLHDTKVGEIITVQDSAKWNKNKLGVFGYSEQKVSTGLNKFDEAEFARQSNGYYSYDNTTGLTALKDDGRAWVNTTYKINVTGGQSYFATIDNATNLKAIQFCEYNENGTYINIATLTANGTVTFPSNCSYIYPKILYTSYPTVIGHVMLNEGGTAKPYEPFNSPSPDYLSDVQSVSGNLEFVRHGKNYFKITDGEKSFANNSLTMTKSNQEIILNGTIPATYTISIEGSTVSGNYPVLFRMKKGKSYFFKLHEISGSISAYTTSFSIRSKTGTPFQGKTFQSIKNGYKFTPTQDEEIVGIFSYTTETTFTNYKFAIQVEESDVATDYEPYNENRYNFTLEDGQELCAIKTTDEKLANYTDENGQMWIADYLADDGIRKKIGKVIFNGTETFEIYATSKGKGFSTPKIENLPIGESIYGSTDKNSLLSNYFKALDRTSLYFDGAEGIAIEKTQNKIMIYTPTIQDLTTFNTWLLEKYNEGKPFIIYYPLESEEKIPYTAEQQKQYDALQNLSMQKGTNNLYCTNELMKNMSLTYMQDTQMYIDNKDKKQDERITAIEELLSTTTTSAMLIDNLESDLESEV